MRVTALDSDVLVFISDLWQTTCTAVRSGEEGFVIDSPVYPEELTALPEILTQAGFPASGLLATHGDWDHLLGRLAFPGASLGCGEPTAERLAAEPGAAQRRLREFDAEHYVPRPAPLALGSLQALPSPGKLELGQGHQMELHAAGGHTADGTAYWLPWLGTLICGDYLSPVEIPMLSPGGSLAAYRATLDRLAPLVEQAEWVIPGHGTPLDHERATTVLAEDRAYLEALAGQGSGAESGGRARSGAGAQSGAALPSGRASAAQRRIHTENLTRVRT